MAKCHIVSRYGLRGLHELTPTSDVPWGLGRRYRLPAPLASNVSTAEAHGLAFFLLGATPEENDRALTRVRAAYPRLRVAGRHGYFGPHEEEALAAELLAFGTDVLWVGLGLPREQEVAVRLREKLVGVTWIKTCGGLFNFLSGSSSRAPDWLQRAGFEWSYRLVREPRRLFWRYLATNGHALYLIVRHSAATRVGAAGQ